MTTSSQRKNPFIIDRAAKGDFGPFLAALPEDSTIFSEGLYLSIVCSEGTRRIDASQVGPLTAGTFLSDYRIRQQMKACAEWPISRVEPEFFVPTISSVPILILSGEMDAVTPPRFAREICAELGNCRMVSIPTLAHGPFDLDRWTGGTCFDQLAIDFYETPNPTQLDPSCIGQMAPPGFFVSAE